MTLDRFKRRLLDANRQGFLTLARLDLAGAVDPIQLSKSEVLDRGASFHVVRDPDADGY